MKQLSFEFFYEEDEEDKKIKNNFPLHEKEQLIKQMAISIIKVYKKGGIKNNDNNPNKC